MINLEKLDFDYFPYPIGFAKDPDRQRHLQTTIGALFPASNAIEPIRKTVTVNIIGSSGVR